MITATTQQEESHKCRVCKKALITDAGNICKVCWIAKQAADRATEKKKDSSVTVEFIGDATRMSRENQKHIRANIKAIVAAHTQYHHGKGGYFVQIKDQIMNEFFDDSFVKFEYMDADGYIFGTAKLHDWRLI